MDRGKYLARQLFESSNVLARNSLGDTLRTTRPKYDGKKSVCLILIGRIFKRMKNDRNVKTSEVRTEIPRSKFD